MAAARDKPIILYLVTEDWYFWSHRLPIARAARDAGWEVLVATRVENHGEQIEREGFRLIPIRMRRRSLAPWREFAAVTELIRIYRRERPDLVHQVAMKPVLYGSLAAAFTGVPAVVNALAGLGYVFTSAAMKARLLRPLIKTGFRLLLDRANARLILQNPADVAAMRAGTVAPKRITLIRGSGVDTKAFSPGPEPEAPLVAVMVSRMLWDKGVGELVEAARLLRERKAPVDVVLVGPPDPENPASISEGQLRDWQASGDVAWWGERSDIAQIWAKSHIAVLPSHREGLPKSLLEAAACGRPLVAADVSGCREVVRPGETGILVLPHDPKSLADALERLATDPELRRRMGSAARELVKRELSQEVVVERTMALYRELSPEGP
jgi:glycosyltransferase involved in cell wall biosynthesis